MMQKRFVHIAAAASLVLAAGLAQASGSDGGGMAQTSDAAAYNVGKAVYATKFACSGCSMSGKSLDATAARELVANKGSVTLSADESAALDVYLKRRFKL